MPSVMCYGRVVITKLADDEVRIAHSSGILYMKRRGNEDYDDFVRRVVAHCERNY